MQENFELIREKCTEIVEKVDKLGAEMFFTNDEAEDLVIDIQNNMNRMDLCLIRLKRLLDIE